jgi:HSP90 family molecular chaperone
MTSTLEKTRVDLAGLMRVLGEALYSTPHVAIRELVQNAHDSCARRALEDREPFEPVRGIHIFIALRELGNETELARHEGIAQELKL